MPTTKQASRLPRSKQKSGSPSSLDHTALEEKKYEGSGKVKGASRCKNLPQRCDTEPSSAAWKDFRRPDFKTSRGGNSRHQLGRSTATSLESWSRTEYDNRAMPVARNRASKRQKANVPPSLPEYNATLETNTGHAHNTSGVVAPRSGPENTERLLSPG